MEHFDEIEIEILKSKIEGLETEVLSLRNKLRTQSEYFTKSVKILSKMDFLLQMRHSLDNGQLTTDVIVEGSGKTTDEITDQQIDEALDKEIYEVSDDDLSHIEEVIPNEETEGNHPGGAH